MTLVIDHKDRGFYSPSLIDRWAKIIGPMHDYRSDQVISLRRTLISEHINALAGMRSEAALEQLAAGNAVTTSGLDPLGYLHNTLSLLMFAMLCWSLRLNIPKLWRERDPTKCPHCRYSTIGLTTNTCPECGKPIT